MLKRFVRLFAGDPQKKVLEKYAGIVDEVNQLESRFEELDDEALKAKTSEFRARLANGETLDDLLPEAFAVVREASKRTLGQRHYDVQIIGGAALHQGSIIEMRTGEGKTLVATLPIYLNALTGRGVHLVTVNDYLARRDARWMAPIYNLLGLSVGVLQMAARTENGKKPFWSIWSAHRPTRISTSCVWSRARRRMRPILLMARTASSDLTTCAIIWSTSHRSWRSAT